MRVPIPICMEITCQPFTTLNTLDPVTMGELLTGHVKTNVNPAALLTKVVGGGQKRKTFVQVYLYDIHDVWKLLLLLIGLRVLEVPLLLLNMA